MNFRTNYAIIQVNKSEIQDKKFKFGDLMKNILREVKKGISFYTCDNINFPAHVHEDIELIFVKQGAVTAFCDGKEYMLTKNSVFLIFPNQIHRYVNSNDGNYVVLILKPSFLLRYTEIFIEGEPVSSLYRFNDGEDDNAIFLLETALKEFLRDGFSDVIAAYLTAFFGKILKFYSIEKDRFSRNTVLQILEYCSKHYREEITISEIADKLHMSRSCVSHIFSKRLAINFCEYINTLRLSDAVKLLKNKNYSITEIADISGFGTIRTFNRAFLKHYGISPSEYRKKLSKVQEEREV